MSPQQIAQKLFEFWPSFELVFVILSGEGPRLKKLPLVSRKGYCHHHPQTTLLTYQFDDDDDDDDDVKALIQLK